MTAATSARVTLVVTPRERFGVARESLDSIYEQSDIPFDLVYIDAGSPEELSSWLAESSRTRGFRHIALPHFVSPNQARNIGIAHSQTDYVVFIDNDVICAPGWLSRLVSTADETRAEVVAPLTCHGFPLHTKIHQAGATFADNAEAFFATPRGERILNEKMKQQDDAIADAPDGPIETQCCEFHCALVRRDVFDRLGLLDEEMLATKEHVDFCLSVIEAGGRVLLEPRSVVTYLFPNRQKPITRSDWPYFLLRWSEDWQLRSLDRLEQKWGLKPDQPFLTKMRGFTRWRYTQGLVRPMVRKVPLSESSDFVRIYAGKVIGKAVQLRGRALTRSFNEAAAAGKHALPLAGPMPAPAKQEIRTSQPV